MKVLMLGWEFPPISSGGLGTACFGLTKGLTNQGVEVTFVMPKGDSNHSSHVNLIIANDVSISKVKLKAIDSTLVPYISSEGYDEMIQLKFGTNKSKSNIYGKDLYKEVHRFAQKASIIAEIEGHDVIHAHDWMTYKAGIQAKKVSGKPLVVHIHATEFDRTGGNPNQKVYNIEREGMCAADKVIAVSNFTKNKVVEHYGIPAEKVEVVHNAVEFNDNDFSGSMSMKDHEKVVLFLGRITLQKGPDYFLYAAKKVLEKDPNVKFVIAGNGDMETQIIDKAAELGMADKVLFTGFLSGSDVDRAYQMADLYVMPSVSEPFGITPLEAMRNRVPVLISNQSGVSEVIDHCLKVNFWDIDQMASKILSVLNYNSLHSSLKENGSDEVKKFDWNNPAKQCVDIYHSMVNG